MRKLMLAITTFAVACVGPAQIGYSKDQDKDKDKDKTVTAAPEIDPASAISALTLLAGGLAVIRGRRRRG
jgi:hypothetical protein